MRINIIPVFVLFFGMVSCKSDNKTVTPDGFRIQEPKILLKKNSELRGFSGFSKQAAPELLLEDEIQFQEAAGSFTLSYTSSCKFKNNKEIAHVGSRLNPKSARFLTFLNPDQLFAIGESEDNAVCSFNFVAINPNASIHHFLLPVVHLKDEFASAELKLMHPKSAGNVKMVSFEKWHEYFLTLASSSATEIAIICASGKKIFPIQLTDRLNLSSMPLQELPLNWSLGAQNCRISQLQSSAVIATTSNLVILSPELQTKLSGQAIQHPRQTHSPFNPHLVSATYRFEVTNPDPYPIRLRLPKQNLNFTGDDTSYEFGGFLLARLPNTQNAFEWTSEQMLTIEPGQTLTVHHYTRVDKEHCKLIFNSSFYNRNGVKLEVVSQNVPKNKEMVLKELTIQPYSIPVSSEGEHEEFLGYCSPPRLLR